jgi:hypothetical protein
MFHSIFVNVKSLFTLYTIEKIRILKIFCYNKKILSCNRLVFYKISKIEKKNILMRLKDCIKYSILVIKLFSAALK